MIPLSLGGCASQEFQMIASNVLGSSGVVSRSQAEALLKAGEHVVSASTPLTEEQEYFLGRAVAANILGRYRPLRNPGLQRYINLVGRAVAAVSDRPDTFRGYHFLVLDTEEINGLAAPAGFIFVTRGLLRQVTSEDELAAVLAHEVAHIVFNHGVAAISQSKLTKALAIVGREAADEYRGGLLSEMTDLFSESVEQVTEALLTSGYSRSQEYRADEYAVELLVRLGYDPAALARVLGRLDTLAQASTHARTSQGGWFDTHPEPEDRIDELADSRAGGKATLLTGAGAKVRSTRFNAAFKSIR
jgi:predicted Zn-dependent protease